MSYAEEDQEPLIKPSTLQKSRSSRDLLSNTDENKLRSDSKRSRSRKSQPYQGDGSVIKVKFAEKPQSDSLDQTLDETEFEEKARQLIYKEAWEDLE